MLADIERSIVRVISYCELDGSSYDLAEIERGGEECPRSPDVGDSDPDVHRGSLSTPLVHYNAPPLGGS
jgi:hypothetical protein